MRRSTIGNFAASEIMRGGLEQEQQGIWMNGIKLRKNLRLIQDQCAHLSILMMCSPVPVPTMEGHTYSEKNMPTSTKERHFFNIIIREEKGRDEIVPIGNLGDSGSD